MFEKIMTNISSKASSSSLVITGFAHVIDTWENDKINSWKYNTGLVRLLAKQQNININHCLLIYSRDTQQKQRALKDMKVCANEVIEKIGIVNLENKLSPNELQILIDMSFCDVETVNNVRVSQFRAIVYPDLGKFREGYAKALVSYIADLGGKNIQLVNDGLFVQFDIASNILDNKERAARLGLERDTFQLTLSISDFEELQKKIPGITIETISDKETQFTFVANNQRIRDIINSTCSRILKSSNEEEHLAALLGAAGLFSALPEKEQKDWKQAVSAKYTPEEKVSELSRYFS